MDTQTPKLLFQSYKLGDVQLRNRFVMSALTRARCDPKTGIPGDVNVKYYTQRASAGLILTECSPVSMQGNTYPASGGIFTKEQVAGWKRVVDSVHSRGGKIFNQIWHGGRAVHPDVTKVQNIGPSAIAIRGDLFAGMTHQVPKEMTKEDIQKVKEEFRQAAINCKEAGFDGLELHGANGYLIDQFLRDGSNKRTDEYGGSVQNRSRLALEVIDILIQVYGAGRVGIKLSPVAKYQDMYDSDPLATYSYILQELSKKKIAFVELVEAGDLSKNIGEQSTEEEQMKEVSKTLRPYFKGTLIINNGVTPETAEKAIKEGYADLASFGRLFISNPDLVERIQNKWTLAESNPQTYFFGGENGYIDYIPYESAEKKADRSGCCVIF